MKIPLHRSPQRGIALIIVMFIVVVFGMMAALLAYTMKVESQLARNSSWETEMYWMGYSGIERAKAFVQKSGQQGYHSLNQLWAGGTGETNAAFEGVLLSDVNISHGKMSIRIIDCERKFNVNMAAAMPDIMNQAFLLMGIDAGEAPNITASIQDWIDADDNVSAGANDTETAFYRTLDPPYAAKNGPIDDLTELMKIRGITPAMFYGNGNGGEAYGGLRRMRSGNSVNPAEEIVYPLGFVDLFTTLGGPYINANTAGLNVLQMIPDISADIAQEIIRIRAGPNGIDGDEDDTPFKSPGELASVPGMNAQLARRFTVRSSIFQVQVECQIDQFKRTFHAYVRPMNANQSVTLYTWWN